MTPLVALCADETSMRHPELMGLEGEHLASQTWLRLFTSGQEMRTFLKNDRAVDEAWVISCDDIEPINLAATLKRDRGDLRVCLITFQGTGSLRSRASAAAVDVMLTSHALASRYGAFKRVRSGQPRQPRYRNRFAVWLLTRIERRRHLQRRSPSWWRPLPKQSMRRCCCPSSAAVAAQEKALLQRCWLCWRSSGDRRPSFWISIFSSAT